jgi:membrane-associated phospholipid phosphatase
VLSFPDALRLFGAQFFAVLPGLLPTFLLAWLATFFGIIALLRSLKTRVRTDVLRLDASIRTWALALRFRDALDHTTDRVLRTWFFRFWTNFASAPALITFSLAVPIWAAATRQPDPQLFYLPGLSYTGSMFLSFVSKRVFKRVRPTRMAGSFGHKLKDGSFPSGHSLTSLCFWVMLVVTGITVGWSAPVWGMLALATLIIISMTGLSRIYLGVHFPSDVLGGFSIGVIWCLVCYFTLRPVLY